MRFPSDCVIGSSAVAVPMEKDALFAELAQLDARIRRLETGVDGAVATSWAELYELFGEEMPGADLGLRTADLAAATIAGLAGGVLDLQPAISSALTSEDLHQQLDAAFKQKVKDATGQNGTVSIDNALGGGRNHRLVGPTHDLFRLFSAVRAVQNGQFVSAVKGVRKVNTAYRAGLPPYLKVESPGDALILVLMHWAADFFSAQSLPIPGWSRLAEINERDFVEWLFRAYREGANLRAMVSQFLSNLSGLALISIVLHLYRYIDLFWVTERRPIKLATFNLSNDLRFRWMSRNANLTAMTVSTAHAALAQNFFAWNYMSFVKFFADARAVEKVLDTRHAEIDARTERLLQDLTGSNASCLSG